MSKLTWIRRLLTSLFLFPCLGKCAIANLGASGVPVIASVLAWPWDICRKDSLIEKQFFIPYEGLYQFLIGFAGEDAITEDGKFNEKANQSWRSQFGEYDRTVHRPTGPLSVWIGHGGSSAVTIKNSLEQPNISIPKINTFSPPEIGVVVPILVQLEGINAGGVNNPIFIGSIKTAGRMSGGYMATRAILWARLKRGKYRFAAKILENSTPLPEGVYTYLLIGRSPK